MSRSKPKQNTPQGRRPFASAFRWLALILLTASLWVLIATDGISQSRAFAVFAAAALSLVLFLRICYLLNLARISRSGSNAWSTSWTASNSSISVPPF